MPRRQVKLSLACQGFQGDLGLGQRAAIAIGEDSCLRQLSNVMEIFRHRVPFLIPVIPAFPFGVRLRPAHDDFRGGNDRKCQ